MDGRNAYEYDPWENAVRPLETERAGERLTVKLELVPLKSAIIILDSEAIPEGAVPAARAEGAEVPFLGPWRRSVCAGMFVMNEYFKKPIVRMAVGPIGVIAAGVLINLFAAIGWYSV